jgi:hypothetical protein
VPDADGGCLGGPLATGSVTSATLRSPSSARGTGELEAIPVRVLLELAAPDAGALTRRRFAEAAKWSESLAERFTGSPAAPGPGDVDDEDADEEAREASGDGKDESGAGADGGPGSAMARSTMLRAAGRESHDLIAADLADGESNKHEPRAGRRPCVCVRVMTVMMAMIMRVCRVR